MVHRNMEETSRVNGSMGLATSWRITLHEAAGAGQKGRIARGTRGAKQGIICRTIFCKALPTLVTTVQRFAYLVSG